MAWDNGTSANGRAIFSETVTLVNGTSTYSSTIDFVGRDEGFTALINTGAVNTTGAVTTGLQRSLDGTTWTTLIAAGTFAADCDTAEKVTMFVPATSGDYPYYRFIFTCAADDSSTDIVVKVLL